MREYFVLLKAVALVEFNLATMISSYGVVISVKLKVTAALCSFGVKTPLGSALKYFPSCSGKGSYAKFVLENKAH